MLPCRSLLRQGPYTLHMWSYLTLEEESTTYKADKLSSATNPNVAESMAISILLDRYSFPVVLPNNARSSEFPDSPSSTRSEYTLSPCYSVPSSPLSTLLSTRSSSLQGVSADNIILRPQSSGIGGNKAWLKSCHYASNLPHFLRNVDWMSRKAVEDVHWLLDSFDGEELDIAVALELLSMDFADETVRRLAVQRLESLSDDDVLRYLLQLVQV